MKSSTLLKLDLMAAAEEARLLEELGRQSQALRTYEEQTEVLETYKARLAAGWQNGKIVQAAQARRAEQFSQQARDASQSLAQSIEAAHAKRSALTQALTSLRLRRDKLQARLKTAHQTEATTAQNRAERNRPALPAQPDAYTVLS